VGHRGRRGNSPRLAAACWSRNLGETGWEAQAPLDGEERRARGRGVEGASDARKRSGRGTARDGAESLG